ncbi:MAG TPA: hypothetical protein VG223_17355 [Solirubrobacteraceae bacterium]|nr:hypothetical protein [Solirubrobacteraceae bacterium]
MVPAAADNSGWSARKFIYAGVSCLTALALTLGVAAAAHAAAASSPGPLVWTAPGGVDVRPIDSITCPSTVLCVAVDRGGQVLWSTDPAGGPGAWHAADVDGGNEMTSVSCPSTTLCVAVDGAGNVVTSPDPTGGPAEWAVAKFDPSATQNNTDNAGAVLVRGVSCPSTGLCVAVDAAGNALISTDPTGGAGAWVIDHADTDTSFGCTGTGLTCQPPLVGISCPSTAQCAAVDFSGNLLTTVSPTTLVPWTSVPTYGGGLSSLYGISCPTVSFCEAVDGTTGHAITVNPATPNQQFARALPYSLNGIWCQSQALCLASVQTHGGISGLLGSFDPAAPSSTWTLSSLGGVNAAACLSASLCLAADDEGNIAAGLTTKAITIGLDAELLSTRHLPTIATLNRTHGDTLAFTSPIAAQVTLAWTVAGPAGTRVAVATASHAFSAPGTARLPLPLTTAGRRLFKAAKRPLTLTATATFATSTGSVRSVKKLTFKKR